MPSPNQPVAIITGASAGIGRAIAHAIAKAGHTWGGAGGGVGGLVITARNEDRLNAAAKAIADDTGAPVLPIVSDAANPADMDDLIAATIEQFNRLDVLVNNAGIARTIPIEQSDSAAFLEAYILNVFSPAAAIRAAWPHFKAAGQGTIINIASRAVLDPFPGFFIYASSKAALCSLTRSAVNDAQSEGFNLRAFSICPGAVETELLRANVDESQCPPEACLAPEDVANLTLACIRGDHDQHNAADIYIHRAENGSIKIDPRTML